jgi:hypothetical protein
VKTGADLDVPGSSLMINKKNVEGRTKKKLYSLGGEQP